MSQTSDTDFIAEVGQIETNKHTLYYLAKIILTDHQHYLEDTALVHIKLIAVEASTTSFEEIHIDGYFKSSMRRFRYDYHVQVGNDGARTIICRQASSHLYHRQIVISTLQPVAQLVMNSYGIYSLAQEKFISPIA